MHKTQHSSHWKVKLSKIQLYQLYGAVLLYCCIVFPYLIPNKSQHLLQVFNPDYTK